MAEQPSKKEFCFEVVCPGKKSYLVSNFILSCISTFVKKIAI